MKNMGTVLMYPDALNFFRVNIAGNMVSLVNHQTFFAMQGSLPGKHRAKEPRPYNQIIILHLFPR